MTARGIGVAVGLLLASGVGGYAVGRYATPPEVVTKVETRTEVKVEERVVWKDRDVEHRVEGPVRTVTRVVEVRVPCEPGGSVPGVETTTTVEQGPVVVDHVTTGEGGSVASSSAVATSAASTTVTREAPRLLLQAGAEVGEGWKTGWNAGGSYRLAGPVWLGAAYHSEKRVELRVGLTL